MAESLRPIVPLGLAAAGGLSFGVSILLFWAWVTGDMTELGTMAGLTRITVMTCGVAFLLHLHMVVAHLLPLAAWLKRNGDDPRGTAGGQP